MRVRLRNPDREVELAGPKRVRELLAELGVDPDTVLVIRERELITREVPLREDDEIEIRPVISGGAVSPTRAG
jgi:sulfur carrier protein ThiS